MRGRSKIDFSLMERFTDRLLCGRCYRKGRRTPVPQLVSHRHGLLTLCAECRAETDSRGRRLPAPVLIF
jgi:hypothetical protein